jgi:hypothetical protein
MRHLLFALLIALLPLRGWVGDAMATRMAAGQLQHQHQPTQTAAQADHVHGAADAAHANQHEEAASETTLALHDCAGQADEGGSHSTDGHCETCAACQACHTVALSLAAPDLMPVFSVSPLPRQAAAPFASADTALRKKPPIS